MTKYEVVIRRIDRKRNHGMRYEIIVYWDRPRDIGSIRWSRTLWGAHREAKRAIAKHERAAEVKTVVEEYTL